MQPSKDDESFDDDCKEEAVWYSEDIPFEWTRLEKHQRFRECLWRPTTGLGAAAAVIHFDPNFRDNISHNPLDFVLPGTYSPEKGRYGDSKSGRLYTEPIESMIGPSYLQLAH